MANEPTLPRIKLQEDWIDLYAASGITVGSQVLVSIEAGNELFLCESATKPDVNTTSRFYLPATQKQVIVDVNSVGLWGRKAKTMNDVLVLCARRLYRRNRRGRIMPIRYNTRPVILGEYVTSWNGRTGAVVPQAGDYDACQITYNATVLDTPVNWACEALDLFNTKINNEMLYSRGDSSWGGDGTEYPAWYVQNDSGWLMKSNKVTTDRPAPQALGNPTFIFPDTPAFVTQSFLGVVHAGLDITFTEAGWLETLRIYSPPIDADTNLRIIIADITDPNNILTEAIEEPIVNPNDWTILVRAKRPVGVGTKFRIFIDVLTSSANTEVTGGWNAGGDKDIPATSEWSHDKDNELFINKVDLDTVDRSAELLGIIINSTIRFSLTANPNVYREYRVTSAPIDAGAFVDWDVDLIDEQGDIDDFIGDPTTMLATIPVAQQTEYSEIVGYFPAGQPTWGTCTGYLSLNGVEQSVPSNGYGVDIEFQRATVSPDWDFLAFTSEASASSSQVAMPLAPTGQYSVAINNQWVNSAQISGNPVYSFTEATIGAGGLIQTNNTDLSLVTQIIVSKEGLNGANFTAVFEKLKPNAVVSISDYLDNTNFGVYDVSGQAVEAGLSFTIPVTHRDSNGSLTTGELTTLSIQPFADTTGTYAEIYRSNTNEQVLPAAGAVIEFNENGLSNGATPNEAGDSITIDTDGNYSVKVDFTALLEKRIEFDLFVRVNGVNVRQIGVLSSRDGNDDILGYSLGANLALVDGDVVQIYAVPESNNRDIDIYTGSRFYITKL